MTVIVFSMKFLMMDSFTRVILLMLLLSITRFDDQCGVADACRIKESSILLNFQKGDNIISRLMNKFISKKTDEHQIDEKIIHPEVPPPSSFMHSMPAQEIAQPPYQYYYLPFQPTPVLPQEETFVVPPVPQQTFYTNSQFWPPVNVEKDVNIYKDVNIKKDLSVASQTDVIPPQLPTPIHDKDHGRPIYSTSILINNEPKQIIPPQAATPNDATRRECNGNCHLHITHGHHDFIPRRDNENSQPNPSHPPSINPVQPIPVYSNPTMLAYPSTAPRVIPPTVSHDSHFDVSRTFENKHASTKPLAYPAPEPPVIHSQDFRFNVNTPVVPANGETNQNQISHIRNPNLFRLQHTLRPGYPQIKQGQGYSYNSDMHQYYRDPRPFSLVKEYPQTINENEKSIPSEVDLPNKKNQPTIIEREKTSSVIVEAQPRSDIPDTSTEYESQELPSRMEEEYRLVPVRSRIVEYPPLDHTEGEVRERGQFSRSGTYVTRQEQQVMPQVSYVDSSLLASKNHFEESKVKSFSIPDKRFRS